ncbi:hypothetical protein Hanom_Chr15g01342781 [Helianthus anomalus]
MCNRLKRIDEKFYCKIILKSLNNKKSFKNVIKQPQPALLSLPLHPHSRQC